MASTIELCGLSAAVYKDGVPIPSGWDELEGGEFTPPSGLYGQAYIKGREIVLAFRGTIDSSSDYEADKQIALWGTSPYFDDAKNFYNVIIANHKNKEFRDVFQYKICIAGHSLGGALAQFLAWNMHIDFKSRYPRNVRPSVRTETFNAPGIRQMGYNVGHPLTINLINHMRYNDFAATIGSHVGQCWYYDRRTFTSGSRDETLINKAIRTISPLVSALKDSAEDVAGDIGIQHSINLFYEDLIDGQKHKEAIYQGTPTNDSDEADDIAAGQQVINSQGFFTWMR